MKVTDEMVERLRAVLIERMARPPGRVASRAALEAVLAPLPEPEPRPVWGAAAEYLRRLNEAEAKLTKVRAWLLGYFEMRLPKDVYALLDGKEDAPLPESEPSCMVTGGFDEQAGRYHAEARAEAAEAKLYKVRAWGEESELMSGDHRRLLAILDGEP